MKRILLLILLIPSIATAQSPDSIQQHLDQSASYIKSILSDSTMTREMLEVVDKMFEWHVQENDHAYLLTLDIPYPDIEHPVDYFSITVVKWKGKARPRIISFAVSSMIDTSKGLSIFFAEDDTLTHKINLVNFSFNAVPFTKITTDYLKVSADYMFLDSNDTKDLFAPMMKYNHMIFVFFGKDGKRYSVAYPLLYFQDAIRKYE